MSARVTVEVNSVCNILLPVDGSDGSVRAVRFVIRLHARLAPLNVHLLHVELPPVPIGLEAPGAESAGAASLRALSPAKALLDAAAVPYVSEVVSGFVGSTIVAYAAQRGCDGIVMGTSGMGSTGQLLGSIARQVIQFTDVPVTLVK